MNKQIAKRQQLTRTIRRIIGIIVSLIIGLTIIITIFINQIITSSENKKELEKLKEKYNILLNRIVGIEKDTYLLIEYYFNLKKQMQEVEK